MATNFPNSVDDFDNPKRTDALKTPNHAQQHSDVNDAIEAIEFYVLNTIAAHAEDHASRHSDGGADEVTVENLAATSTDTSRALRPDGSGGVAFSDVSHAELTSITTDAHHDQQHAHDGADSSGTVAHSDTTGKGTDDHHTEDHAARHSDGGADEVSVENLATASVDVSAALRPDGAGGLAFSDVSHTDLASVSADQHHNEDHASRHSDGGADEVTVENLATASADTSAALRPDGSGGLAFSDVAHSDTTGQTADDHHNEDHASRHADGGADELQVEDLATASVDVSSALRPDGAGGLSFSDVAHTDLTSVSADQHHNEDHASRHAENGADELDVADLGSGAASSGQVPTADGTGGVDWSDQSGGGSHASNHIPGGSDELYKAVRKSADETVNNSTTMQDDDELTVSLPDATTWHIQLNVVFASATSANFKFEFGGTNIGSIVGGAVGGAVHSANEIFGSVRLPAFTALNSASNMSGSGANLNLPIWATVEVSGGTGSLTFRWAQVSVQANNTIVREGSTLMAWRVA